MSDPRTTKHWVIKVNGSTKVDVGPGENVEIGRRPLRPLGNDGHRRLEIDDDTRSMSKRHAVFAVAANGGASVTDLNSTNGSYVVEEKGLRPLTPNQDFILPDSPMRLQFGDVPVDFVRVDVDESDEDGHQITDLFDYAVSGGESADIEPDLNEMSVDDILNLRAGEPTTAFSAADVASRIGASYSSARPEGSGNAQNADESKVKDDAVNADNIGAENPIKADTNQKLENPQDHAIDQISLNVMAPDSQTEDPKARDLFKDAMKSEAEDKDVKVMNPTRPVVAGNNASKPSIPGTADSVKNGLPQNQPQARVVSLPSRQAAGQNSQRTFRGQQPVSSPTTVQPQTNVNGDGNMPAAQTQQTQVAQQQVQQVAQSPRQASQSVGSTGIPASQFVAQQPTAGNVNPERNGTADGNVGFGFGGNSNVNGNVTTGRVESRKGNGSNGFSASDQTSASQDAPVFVAMDENPRQNGGSEGARPRLNFAGSQDSQNDATDSKPTEERNKFMPPIKDVADTPIVSQTATADGGLFGAQQAFKPAFEPGSVFEKVSNGEFDRPEPEVEVEGMSSQDAKSTTDFSVQFEMAKHPELLPFLAMNPSLYDDLYAWLSAVGNDDIDAALSQNSGYIEYRNEVGEGRKE